MKSRWYIILLIGLSSIIFIPFIGSVHLFDWDEINFAESAREMIVTGDYLTVKINYEPFWEKPPLFIWMQVLSMKTFGINEFAARFPNAICGILTILILFLIGTKVFNRKFGISWALTYLSSFLPFFYFKSGIIDPWFNLFIFLSIYNFILFYHRESESTGIIQIILSACFIGLGILTKGPVAFLIFGLTVLVFYIFDRFSLRFKWFHILLYASVMTVVGGFWFILLMMHGNMKIIHDFFVYQIRLFNTEDAGHGGFMLYHVAVLFFGVFPASIFALKAFRKQNFDNKFQMLFKRWMSILFWVVLILFSIVKTKIVHYSSMCYIPLTFLGAWTVYHILDRKFIFNKWLKILLLSISFIISLAVVGLGLFDKIKFKIIDLFNIQDSFTLGNLSADVHWIGFEWIIGLILLTGTIFLLWYFYKDKAERAFFIFSFSLVIFMLSAILFFTSKVEQYSQRAAIDFYINKKNENCLVKNIGYKSYAPLFYNNQMPDQVRKMKDEKRLLSGNIDKTVYFVLKNYDKERFIKSYPDINFLWEKNGFVFFVRNLNKLKINDK